MSMTIRASIRDRPRAAPTGSRRRYPYAAEQERRRLLHDADRLEHPELDVLAMVLRVHEAGQDVDPGLGVHGQLLDRAVRGRAHEAGEPGSELLGLAVLPGLEQRGDLLRVARVPDLDRVDHVNEEPVVLEPDDGPGVERSRRVAAELDRVDSR